MLEHTAYAAQVKKDKTATRVKAGLCTAVIEIPRTEKMHTKYEVDLFTGEMVDEKQLKKFDPPHAFYWHYGAIPGTLSKDGEALDVIVYEDPNASREIGEPVDVRIIGMIDATDGQGMYDDPKIIAVPNTPQYSHIQSIEDLNAHSAQHDKDKQTFSQRLAEFAKTYRKGRMEFGAYGDASKARAILEQCKKRYDAVPKAKSPESNNIFFMRQHIHVPAPTMNDDRTAFTIPGDILTEAGKEKGEKHKKLGHVVSANEANAAVKKAGESGRMPHELSHVNAEILVQEKLAIIDRLVAEGVTVYTSSPDEEWLKLAREHGAIGIKVEQEKEGFFVENMPAISSQDYRFVRFLRSDGKHVLIAPGISSKEDNIELAIAVGAISEDDRDNVVVITPPPEMIPWPIPTTNGELVTYPVDFIDLAYSIWPDCNNQPHLVINERVRDMAKVQGREGELKKFEAQCLKEGFAGVHYVEVEEGASMCASPVNCIDVGTALIVNAALSERSQKRMEKTLGRTIDRSLNMTQHAFYGAGGLRCATFPVDKSTLTELEKGDVLAHAKAIGETVEIAHLYGTHEELEKAGKAFVEAVKEKRGENQRKELSPINDVKERRKTVTTGLSPLPTPKKEELGEDGGKTVGE